jgi:hypothetical protein
VCSRPATARGDFREQQRNVIAHRRLAFTNLSMLSNIVHMIYSARVLIGSLSIRAYIGTCLHSEYDRAEMEIEG